MSISTINTTTEYVYFDWCTPNASLQPTRTSFSLIVYALCTNIEICATTINNKSLVKIYGITSLMDKKRICIDKADNCSCKKLLRSERGRKKRELGGCK